MKVILSGDIYIVILEMGENLIESIRKFASEHDFCGLLVGIGALKNPKIAYFDLKEKKYLEMNLTGEYELTSLIGNIGRLENGDIVSHIHVTLGDREGKVLGGHLLNAEVAVTVELFCTRTRCFIRKRDEKLGLNLIYK